MSISVWNYCYLLFAVWFEFQILLCEAVFCVGQPRKKMFLLRAVLSLAAYALLCYLLAAPWGMFGDATAVLLYQIPYFFMVWCMSLAGIWLCFEVNWTELLFFGVGGYLLQHLIYSLVMFTVYFVPDIGTALQNFLFECLAYAVIGVAFWAFVVRPWKKNGGNARREPKVLSVAGIMLCSCIVLSVLSGLWHGDETATAVSTLICRPYGFMCCAVTLALLFGFSRERALEDERETMELLLSAEQEQHRMQKESIDIINMKCHDLRHQISLFRSAEGGADRESAVLEMEKAVDMYDASVRTGNEQLDLILTQKKLVCDGCGIGISCMADGTVLSFLSASDILSLFGNILDNAIEAAREMPEDMRLVSLLVRGQGTGAFIHAENTFAGTLEFENGLPVTTKKDKNYHGFGTRSIRYIAQKYDGECNMYAEDGKFNVDILFLR